MKKWLTIGLLLPWIPLARAASLIPMYLDDLTAESQTVVYGRVAAARAEWDDEHDWIYTVYTVEAAQYLKGQLGPTFELVEPGGERDGMAMLVEGVPVFKTGQDAVLFVWTDPQGRHQVTGFEQGAVGIETDAATGARIASRAIPLGSARAADKTISNLQATGRPLAQLLDQVRASVASTRPPEKKE
jgi:hypothetical protein